MEKRLVSSEILIENIKWQYEVQNLFYTNKVTNKSFIANTSFSV